jgi:hypothetical protein
MKELFDRPPARFVTEQVAQAHRHRNRTSGGLHGALHNCFPDLFCPCKGKGWVAIIQYQQKLLTTVTPHEIIRPHRGNEAFRRFPQDLIPSRWPNVSFTLLK